MDFIINCFLPFSQENSSGLIKYMKNIEEFITTLIKYRNGEIKLDDVDEAYELVDSFPHFSLYLNDGAIRAEDTAYSVMQEKALSHFIKLLKIKDYEEAQNVTFKD